METVMMKRFGALLLLVFIMLLLCITDFYIPSLGWDSEITNHLIGGTN